VMQADDDLVKMGETAALWSLAKIEAEKACKVFPMMKHAEDAINRCSAEEVVKAVYAGAWVHGYMAAKEKA
jgi:hypothetical protein